METERVRQMVEATTLIASIMGAIVMMIWLWKMVKWLWPNPKRLERVLRDQGLQANPYKFWIVDLKQIVNMHEQAKSMPMTSLSHDLSPRFFSFVLHMLNKYGKNAFMWFGPAPRLIITRPEQIKDVLNKYHDFTKRHFNPILNYVNTGLVSHEGEKWAKHRKIINPAFNLENLKTMMAALYKSCNDMIREWEKMLSPSDGTCEVDVYPWLTNMTRDVISRAAFGSSYEEGRNIFVLLTEQAELVTKDFQKYHIPFWRLVHGKDLRRIKEIDRMVEDLVKGIIKKKEKALKAGEAKKKDLLGILLESNRQETESQGNHSNVGLSMKDVIEECKIFYFGGQETTSSLLSWTMMLLSCYPNWQTRAREEVLQVFGNQKPNFDELSRLKIMSMILYESWRLYPPAAWIERSTEKDMKLGNLLVPGGVQIFIPILVRHHDQEIWGSDANEFRPERFGEGISKAGKGNSSVAYFPFGWAPRTCVGQNFALLEVKMALSMILQRLWFELSPSYCHAPILRATLQPQHGVHVILHRLES